MAKLRSYWWTIEGGTPNFGDDISPFILGKQFQAEIERVAPDSAGKILGSGCGEYSIPFRLGRTPRNVLVASVRGPLSRIALQNAGIDCPPVYRDPAMDLPLYVTRDHWPRQPLGVLPHCGHAEAFKSHPYFIDVRRPFREVLHDIWSCERIESSSLHGIIAAEAYGIPATVVDPQTVDIASGRPFQIGFKFYDYFAATSRWPHIQKGFTS
jgi:pyruvyltransferase